MYSLAVFTIKPFNNVAMVAHPLAVLLAEGSMEKK
jgi:hypothetical protein